jgi:ABC-2 type transport system permease protein
MRQTLAIARKELKGYFGSPMALIFVGTFLAITLFCFFWIEAFFARGISDVRPLFRWIPVLLIFLVSALTMRQWSEEQRSGTLETLLTLPVSPIQLVVGKFLAVVTLVAVALALTALLPITVSMLGNLDWGPVIGGYLAAILLASAYAAIGLFVSSRTDNQIVALILTMVVCGVLYMLGTSGVTDFVGNLIGEILRSIAPGSRFESIERGVVDLRDMLYYVSLTGIFLTLNVLSLHAKRWSQGKGTLVQRRGTVLTSVLLIANLALSNVWLYPQRGLRLDLTQHREYTLSQATRNLLSNLQEPLLIRGYFSEKTHPLLAPLVPTIRDMLQEYKIASGGKVQVEIVNPAEDPEKEAEANQVYGIEATPFQVTDRYESTLLNSYFDILIRYGDQSEVLTFQDLIEVQYRRDGNADVGLKNLEYDLTRSIKKVVYGFQSVDAIFAGLSAPATATLYVTKNTLPASLADAPATMEKVLNELKGTAKGKFTYTVVDPDGASAKVSRQELYERYGIQPIPVSLFSNQSYYLHLIVDVGDKQQVMYPPTSVSEAEVRTSIESVLKRAAPGFLKVVGYWAPQEQPTYDAYGQQQDPLSSWNVVRSSLSQEYEVTNTDLSTGHVPDNVNVLVLAAPQGLTDVERFAVDQYLMRGGAVIVAAGNYKIVRDQYTGSIALEPIENSLRALLSSYGLTVENTLVMDTQNEPFPVPVTRTVAGYQVQQYQALDYPFFVDIRSSGMASNHPVVSNLPALTINWVSPITIDETKNAQRKVATLLQSTKDSWALETTAVQPDFGKYPGLGFPQSEQRQAYPLAVAVQGVFDSYFKGKASPLSQASSDQASGSAAQSDSGVIETSAESARLVVVGSAEFVDDVVFRISTTLSSDRYVNTLTFMQNAVAWCTEDLDLLTIRARGSSTRVLDTMTERTRTLWEVANYSVALLAVVAIAVIWNLRRRGEQAMQLAPVEGDARVQKEVKE